MDQEQQDGQERSPWRPTRRQVLWASGILIFVICSYVFGWKWTGIAKRTLWDWLELLIVPAALALGVYWLNRRQTERDQQAEDAQQERALAVESQRAQDEALQAYLDQIGQLLLDKERPLRESNRGDEVRTLARARTLTVLDTLDSSRRKRRVVKFLYEAKLICADDAIVRLSKVNLYRADLSDADLSKADLSGTDLSDADLSKADLSKADLSGAKGITNEELEQQALTLDGATMPNGQKYEDWLKDKKAKENDENNE